MKTILQTSRISKALLMTLLSTILYASAPTVRAQWSGSPNIYYNGGNVGVGTTTPGTINGNSPLNAGTKLQITGPATDYYTAALIINGYDYSHLVFSSQHGTTNQRLFALTQQANRLDFANFNDAGGSSTNILSMLNNGNVGIGTTSPRARFDVFGLRNEAWFGSEANGPQQLVIGNTRRQNYGDVMIGKNLGGKNSSDSYQTLYTASASTYGYSGIEQRYGGDIYFYGSDSATTANTTVTPTV